MVTVDNQGRFQLDHFVYRSNQARKSCGHEVLQEVTPPIGHVGRFNLLVTFCLQVNRLYGSGRCGLERLKGELVKAPYPWLNIRIPKAEGQRALEMKI